MNLVCTKCGGTVVLEVSTMISARAVVFEIGLSGVSSPMIELQASGNGAPKYICSKCGAVSDTEEKLGLQVSASCAICTKTHPVSKLNALSSITPMCDDCSDKRAKPPSPQIARLLSNLEIGPSARKYRLSSVLLKVSL